MNLNLKIAGIFAGLAGVVALTSAISTNNVPLEVGNQAPEIATVNISGDMVRLSEMKGQEVILNFWSVKDAESRISNIRLAREAESNGTKYLGICVDDDEQLAQEVIKADRLPSQSQYFANEQIRDEYRLNHGTRTVKIDPYGIVASID